MRTDVEPLSSEITSLLGKWRSGDPKAAENLMPMVYSELRRLARRFMASERPDHTLQPTALVHEAFLQLSRMDIPWNDRVHFLAVCTRAMRRILVDHARSSLAEKRGGGAVKVDIDAALADGASARATVLALDEALERLATFDPRKSEITELHYFGGLKQEEVAAALSISVTTVERELRMAKAWLHHEITST